MSRRSIAGPMSGELPQTAETIDFGVEHWSGPRVAVSEASYSEDGFDHLLSSERSRPRPQSARHGANRT